MVVVVTYRDCAAMMVGRLVASGMASDIRGLSGGGDVTFDLTRNSLNSTGALCDRLRNDIRVSVRRLGAAVTMPSNLPLSITLCMGIDDLVGDRPVGATAIDARLSIGFLGRIGGIRFSSDARFSDLRVLEPAKLLRRLAVLNLLSGSDN